MLTKREWLLFFAGDEAFHTLTHLTLNVSGALPIEVFSIRWTYQLNTIAIVTNALITVGLLWWASKIKD